MAAEEKDTKAAIEQARIAKVARAIDIYAERLKQHLESDQDWLAGVGQFPDLDESGNGVEGDSAHLEAAGTLFAVWWGAQSK